MGIKHRHLLMDASRDGVLALVGICKLFGCTTTQIAHLGLGHFIRPQTRYTVILMLIPWVSVR